MLIVFSHVQNRVCSIHTYIFWKFWNALRTTKLNVIYFILMLDVKKIFADIDMILRHNFDDEKWNDYDLKWIIMRDILKLSHIIIIICIFYFDFSMRC